MPTSVRQLAQIVIREENRRIDKDGSLAGVEYATGIIDVARALMLLDRFGPKLALSSQGYACHALNSVHDSEDAVNAFLLNRVIESDGEYTLNILRLVGEGLLDTLEIGRALFDRFLHLVEFKKKWTLERVESRYAQKRLVAQLDDANRVLRKAIDKIGSRADFFHKHTVTPRLEWLQDLACIELDGDGKLSCSEAGHRLLHEVKLLGGWQDSFVCLPLSEWLATQLSITNLYSPENARDFGWKIVASMHANTIASAISIESQEEFLRIIRSIYPLVKLSNFNEADAQSIYEVMSSNFALRGHFLPLDHFEGSLVQLVRDFPGELFKLSKRRGKGLYVALKSK
jgi:hypothetical protein